MAITNIAVLPEWDKYESKLSRALEHFKGEMTSIRAGRANPAILNKVVVNYYGTPTPIAQMANITVPEARLMVISVWDASALKDVSKAIIAADIGVNPSDDGKVIRLAFPQLTEERRKDLVKTIKKNSEDAKVILRNERRDIMEIIKKLKKDSLVTEDEVLTYEKDVQKLLDGYIATIDKVFKDKEVEILEV